MFLHFYHRPSYQPAPGSSTATGASTGYLVRLLVIVFLAVAGIFPSSSQAQQSPQKERKQKKVKATTQALAYQETLKPAATAPKNGRKKQAVYYPDTEHKRRYRICVIMPLYLEELVRGESVTYKDHIPAKALPGLHFYQGIKLAADSLKKKGARLDIYVYDAGSFAESPDMLIHDRKMDSADLIIGAVEQHDIPVLAAYAKKKRVNFVSTFSNYDGWVKDNQYFTMLQPSVKSHCEYIIDDLSERYAGANVTLLYRTDELADDNAALYILNDLYSDVNFRKLQCNNIPDKEVMDNFVDAAKPNIVVISIFDTKYAEKLLTTLSTNYPNTHFEIYGMPTWHTYPILKKKGAYSNLTINVTYPFNYATTDSSCLNAVSRHYATAFGGSPSETVLMGYETMLWYGMLLKRYGTIFNESYKDLEGAPFTKFRIKPRWDGNGNLLYLENKNIYMSHYQGGMYDTH